jgi:NAD-dependent dihydropyrimidine dehydrogenase PreA subunit
MPPQLKVLLPLFAIFIAIFLVIRSLLIPESFFEYGHYRGNSLIDNANKDLVFANKRTCIECHPDIYEKLLSDLHSGLSCIVCHGPGLEHSISPDSTNIVKKSGRAHCGRCHSINPARAKDAITQIDIAVHHIEKDNCIECHNPHQVWELKE